MKIIEYEKFIEDYKPLQNPSTTGGSYDNTYFETYGRDLEFILDIQKKGGEQNIWTIINSQNEDTWIIPGFHVFDRDSYVLTEFAWDIKDKDEIEINLNEMIHIDEAIKHCNTFFDGINIKFPTNFVQDYYRKHEPLYHDMFTVGHAKYLAIELYEETFKAELEDSNTDKIHDYYSQL